MTIFHGQTSLAVGATLMVKLHGRYNSARIAPIPGAERRGGGGEEGGAGGWSSFYLLYRTLHFLNLFCSQLFSPLKPDGNEQPPAFGSARDL